MKVCDFHKVPYESECPVCELEEKFKDNNELLFYFRNGFFDQIMYLPNLKQGDAYFLGQWARREFVVKLQGASDEN